MHHGIQELETIKTLIRAILILLLEAGIQPLVEALQTQPQELEYGMFVLVDSVLEHITVQHIHVLLGAVYRLPMSVATVKPVFHHMLES